jgi:hypothetical protein
MELTRAEHGLAGWFRWESHVHDPADYDQRLLKPAGLGFTGSSFLTNSSHDTTGPTGTTTPLSSVSTPDSQGPSGLPSCSEPARDTRNNPTQSIWTPVLTCDETATAFRSSKWLILSPHFRRTERPLTASTRQNGQLLAYCALRYA